MKRIVVLASLALVAGCSSGAQTSDANADRVALGDGVNTDTTGDVTATDARAADGTATDAPRADAAGTDAPTTDGAAGDGAGGDTGARDGATTPDTSGLDTGTPPGDAGGGDTAVPPGDATGLDTGVPPADTGTASDTGVPPADTGTASDTAVPPADTGTASDTGGGGADGGGSTCMTPSDCMIALGAPPCGVWTCSGGQCMAACAGCVDGDGDGLGVGPAGACANYDCDDNDTTVGATATRSCYSGPAGTLGVGTCRAGTDTCTAGAWAGCSGSVGPSGEACNNQDDDCDGMTDEGLGTFTCGVGACATAVPACSAGTVGTCTPGTPGANDATCDNIDNDCDGAIDEDCSCVHVAPTGDDAMAMADGNVTPFATIQAAIAYAATPATPPHPRIVCVASGATCPSTNTNVYAGAVRMEDGISVYGMYESANWTRCASGPQTAIAPGVDVGVLFPAAVQTTTVLDGFEVRRLAATTTAGVTVDGARGAVISNVDITTTPAATNSYGVNVVNGGDATVSRTQIEGGLGSAETIAVRVVGGRATLTQNCASLSANGRCADFCAGNPGFRGRVTGGVGVSYAVLLRDAPGSVVETSAMCGNDSDRGAGLKIEGAAAGVVVRGNLINAFGGAQDSHGIWMEDCQGAAPWVVDNELINAAGDSAMTRVDGVRAIGDCHPVIDSNVRITGGAEGGTLGANGVYCGANAAGLASRCVVLGNLDIEGSSAGFPPTAVGVRCDDGGCMRIADNVITGRGGMDTRGIWLGASGTLVDNNEIHGGCPAQLAIGVYAEDSYARVQNNRIFGGTCPNANNARYVGLRVAASGTGREVDVHSNDIAGQGTASGCTSNGIELLVGGAAPPAAGAGVYRNNIVRGGACTTANVVREAAVAADPRVFENNDLDPFNNPAALYFDENMTRIARITNVNALTDGTFAGNISQDALLVAYPTDMHLTASSPCIGAGTPTGAPATDMDRMARSATAPAIGADER